MEKQIAEGRLEAVPLEPAREHIVWDGRFQPFHLGHLATATAILGSFGCPLVLAVIESTLHGVDPGQSDPNPNHAKEENPLTFWERLEMIRLVLSVEGLADRVTILGVPRLDFYWPVARTLYPPRRRICITDKDEYERSKAAFWAALGEEVVVLRAEGLPPISGRLVKQAIRAGGDWRQYLHPASWAYFEAVSGPARFGGRTIEKRSETP
jgi:hypothetical protein